MSELLNDQELARRQALETLRAQGINPFPAQEFIVTHRSREILNTYSEEVLPDGTKNRHNFQSVRLAGRIMAVREAGKAMFMNLQDADGRIQLYLRKEDITTPEDPVMWDVVIKKCLDLGDYVGVDGFAFKTKTGEVSVHVQKFTFLAKSLRPLPVVKTDASGEVHDAFTDPEARYRQRYLDLTVNPAVKEVFITRSKVISSMRSYFDTQGWLEVETPVLQPIHGGAAARPFKTHHHILDMPMYLRIANELYLKRLVIGGFDGVYEIGKMFRNEGLDRTHNPEFTSMEIYIAYKDYQWMMRMVEELLATIARKLTGGTVLQVGDKQIELGGEYARMSIIEGIRIHTGIDVEHMDEAALRDWCRKNQVALDPSAGRAKCIDEIFGEKVEPHLIQPTFVMDYPVEMTPLAKMHRSKPGMVERFELYINGKEVANAYSELNDPIDQRKRLEDQLALAARGDHEAMAMDEEFVKAMEYGMPPMSGCGIGIDRLVMLFTNQSSIQEVLFFPQMKNV